MDRRPGAGRYAHLEREQRWLLARVPLGVSGATTIVDRYIDGTGLRVRHATGLDGVARKLGQKVRVDPAGPSLVRLTNIYLSAAEHDVLAALPARIIYKTRWYIDIEDETMAIDEFHDRHRGLVLAEVELAEHESLLPMPAFAVRDVTDDDRYSGGSLAYMSEQAVLDLLPVTLH